jgi:hypothetical protein
LGDVSFSSSHRLFVLGNALLCSCLLARGQNLSCFILDTNATALSCSAPLYHRIRRKREVPLNLETSPQFYLLSFRGNRKVLLKESAEKGHLLTSSPQVGNQNFCLPAKQILYKQPLAFNSTHLPPVFTSFLALCLILTLKWAQLSLDENSRAWKVQGNPGEAGA